MEITNEWIDRYNEDDLNEQEKDHFRKRLQVSPILRTEVHLDACLSELYRDRETLDLMKKIHAVSQKKEHSGGTLRLLLLAASLLFLIVFGAIIYLVQLNPDDYHVVRNRHHTDKETEQGQSVVPSDFNDIPAGAKQITALNHSEMSPTKQLAMNYKPLADFELLVGTVTRSAYLKLVAPPNNIVIPTGKDILYEWRYQKRPVPVSIMVFDNTGRFVFGTPALLTSSYSIATKDWPGGVYYWKMIMDEDMIFMGKITLL